MMDWLLYDGARRTVTILFVVWSYVWWKVQERFDQPKAPKWVTETSKVIMLGLGYVAIYSIFKLMVDKENYNALLAVSMMSLGPAWAIPTVIYRVRCGRKNIAENDTE